MVSGIHSCVRGREYTLGVPNNDPFYMCLVPTMNTIFIVHKSQHTVSIIAKK